MPCKVLKYKDDWCRIKRPDGKAGWVRKDTVEEI
jgi:SH3-like domain-containing protein